MTSDVIALLDYLAIQQVHLVGWSDGGINGLLLAIRHPKKVAKLAVTGANCWPDTTAVYQEVIDLVQPFYTELKNKPNKTDRERGNWKRIRLLLDEPHILLSQLQTISCPSLIIGGDHDVIKEEHTMLIYKNIPKAYLWILPNSGHSTPVAYKEEFNKTVDEFFKKPFRKIQKEARFY